MNNLLCISNLDFAYGRNPALQRIDLSVAQSSTLGIIGPNGGGKTTLVKLLCGLLKPSAGTIFIDGMTPLQARKRGDVIGYLPQNPARVERFPISVRQMVRLGLTGKTGVMRSFAPQDVAFADELINRVGLSTQIDSPIAELSGGQLQRALIARALSAKPKLLILDEPTTGIDQAGQQRFIELLTELKKQLGLTVIFISHDLRAVSAMSDRVACLNLTLHYHDVPQHLPPDLIYRMFECDLEAAGLAPKPISLDIKVPPHNYMGGPR